MTKFPLLSGDNLILRTRTKTQDESYFSLNSVPNSRSTYGYVYSFRNTAEFCAIPRMLHSNTPGKLFEFISLRVAKLNLFRTLPCSRPDGIDPLAYAHWSGCLLPIWLVSMTLLLVRVSQHQVHYALDNMILWLVAVDCRKPEELRSG
jgi:hypothetical protein